MKKVLNDPRKLVPLCIAALFFLTLYTNSWPCGVKVVFYPLYREMKKECLVFNRSNLHITETDNFKIYYKDIEPKHLKMIMDNGEKSLRKVLQDFDFSLDEKINMIIYGEYRDMAENIGLDTGSAAMGVYYGGTISILDPSEWINESMDINEVFSREGPMVHELTHYIVDYMTSGNVPVWFTEGVALYEEYRINNVEWGFNRKYSRYYEVEDLEEDFYKLDEIKAYKQSFLAVRYICDNYGRKTLFDIIENLSMGKTMDQSVKNVLDMDVDEIFKKACRSD